jgi:aspartyl aminopeptidase
MEEIKTEGQKLQEALLYKPTNVWGKYSDEDKKTAFDFCEGYKRFLDTAKTEREFVMETAGLAGRHGFILLDDIIGNKKKIVPSMKIYSINRKKSVMFAVIGKHPLEEGVNLIGAHIDSPRIDLKQNPVYEDTEMVLFKTHYYGGIKKYQWLAIPLAVHGVIIKGNGDVINIVVGEDGNDPVFTITDLLPHLAGEQMQKK